MHFAFFNLFRNLRKFRVISKNKMKLSNLKTGLLLELKIAPSSFYFRSAGLHCCISPRLFRSIFSRKHQLRFLDCTQCDWVTDDSIQIVAENCPFMESLTLAKCRNIQGKSLSSLLSNCPKLKTLILEGTHIKDEYLGTADWENTNIIELNVLIKLLSTVIFRPFRGITKTKAPALLKVRADR